MTLRHSTPLGLLAAAALLAACSSPVKLDEPTAAPAPVTTATPSGSGGAQTAPAPQSQVATVDLARQQAERDAAAAADRAGRVVYFDYDSFVLRADGRPVVETHAKLLTLRKEARMSLEGHADERGGREYNLALGQKRAEAVARALELLGVNPAQVEAVSFGEERPAEAGSNEAAWAKNRRVELKAK